LYLGRGCTIQCQCLLELPPSPCSSNTSFDIFQYWQPQIASFPIFSYIAKGVLAVPITSVATESSISMGGRVLTKYRSFL
ncbi:putative AC transposase, partial [Bienertia sinuspersici]